MTRLARQLVDAASMETQRILATRTMRFPFALLFCQLSFGQLTSTGNPVNSTELQNNKLEEDVPEERISSKYTVQMELATRHIADIDDLSLRLAAVVGDALNAAAAKHFKQKPQTATSSYWTNNVTTQIERIEELQEETWITFATYFNGEPILGNVIAEDMSLLSSSHISATLHYPFSRLLSQKQLSEDSQSRWWIIALIFAAGLLLVLLGWFILFVYYNSCGRPTLPTYNFPKAVYFKDEETQSSPQEQAERAADIARGATADALESPPPLEIENKEPPEKEEHHGKKAAAPPPPPLQLLSVDHSKSMSIDSWGIDDEHKKFEFPGNKKKERPKAAGKSRPLRTTDGRIMGTVANTAVWDEYAAADVVAKNFGIQPSISWIGPHEHPVPARPTVGGTIQYESAPTPKITMNHVL